MSSMSSMSNVSNVSNVSNIHSMSAVSDGGASAAAAAASAASASASSAPAVAPVPGGRMPRPDGGESDVQQLAVDQTEVKLDRLEDIPRGEGAPVVASAAKVNNWFTTAVIKLREFFVKIGAFLKNIGVGVSDAACWVGRHTFGTLNAAEKQREIEATREFKIGEADRIARGAKRDYLSALKAAEDLADHRPNVSYDIHRKAQDFVDALIEKHMIKNPQASKEDIDHAVVQELLDIFRNPLGQQGLDNNPVISRDNLRCLVTYCGFKLTHYDETLKALQVYVKNRIGRVNDNELLQIYDSFASQHRYNQFMNTVAMREMCRSLSILNEVDNVGNYRIDAHLAARTEREESQRKQQAEAIQRQAREALSANDSPKLKKLCRQDRNGVQAALFDAPDRLERFIKEADHFETLQAVAERSEAYLTRLNTELARKRSELTEVERAIVGNSKGYLVELPPQVFVRDTTEFSTFVSTVVQHCNIIAPSVRKFETDGQALPGRREQIKGDIARIEGLINAEKGKHPSLTRTQANSLKDLKAKINLLRGIASIDSSEGSASTSSGSSAVAGSFLTSEDPDPIEHMPLPPAIAAPSSSSSSSSSSAGSSGADSIMAGVGSSSSSSAAVASSSAADSVMTPSASSLSSSSLASFR